MGWMWDEGQRAVKNDPTPRFASQATSGWPQGHQGWRQGLGGEGWFSWPFSVHKCVRWVSGVIDSQNIGSDFERMCTFLGGFPGGSDGKESACNWETWVQSLGHKDPLEKGMATHSSILAWRTLWGHRVRHSWHWIVLSIWQKLITP